VNDDDRGGKAGDHGAIQAAFSARVNVTAVHKLCAKRGQHENFWGL